MQQKDVKLQRLTARKQALPPLPATPPTPTPTPTPPTKQATTKVPTVQTKQAKTAKQQTVLKKRIAISSNHQITIKITVKIVAMQAIQKRRQQI